MRIFVFVSIIAIANYYVAARLFHYAPIAKPHFVVPILIAAALLGLQILDLRTTFAQTYPALKLLISAATGAFFCALFFTAVADAVHLIIRLLPVATPRHLNTALFAFITLATFASTVIGAYQAIAGPKLREVTVRIKNLPAVFNGYKIVQISDLHVGGTIRKPYVDNVVKIANAANPDLIALTGDFADGTVAELKEDSASLADLKSRDGRFFITGNHEYYHDLDRWLSRYAELGIHILKNRHEVIARGDDKLVIAGVTDYSTREFAGDERSDVSKAAKDMPQDAVKILLMHQPTLYKDAAAAGFDLQLSGHTHNGQFFPWTLTMPFFHHFYKGLGRYEDLQVYVSVGTGYWGPSLRTFNPTEVTVLTLRKA